MELIIVLLSSMSGALVGTAIGILLMYRRIRMPATEAELSMLRGRVQSTEFSLAKETAETQKFKDQVEERDQTIQRNSEELKQAQLELDQARKQAEEETARRSAAEQRAQDLSYETTNLKDQCSEFEAKVKDLRCLSDEGSLITEKAHQTLAACEAQLEASQRQVGELTGEVARLTSESAELRSASEQETRHHLFLETQLGAETERTRQLTSQVAQLQDERSRFDVRLEEERQSARKGMELLLMAQENLARVFKQPACVEPPNGSNGHAAIEA